MAEPTSIQLRWRFGDESITATLPTRAHNRLRVRWPRPSRALSALGFQVGSSFVSPGLAVVLKPAQERLDDDVSARLVLFGHSDPTGSGDDNKALSERRAAAMRALACSDAEAFHGIGEQEGWGVAEYQAMLRGLGFVPGAVDGKRGPMTDAAVEAFVEAQREAWLPAPAPSEGPSLDAATRWAIVAAYVEEYGVGIDPARLLRDEPSGCREFNTLDAEPALERRVTLALVSPGPERPRAEDFPCVAGDSSACALDREQGPRCKFFRVVADPRGFGDPVEFFDFAWLRTPSGKIHLSALTTAPDTDEVRFDIGIADGGLPADPPCSASGDAELRLRELGKARGLVRHGVCHALWDAGEFDPFDPRQWFETDPDAEEIEGLPVPVFRVQIDKDWAYSTPPGRRLDRIVLRGDVEREIIGLLADGSYVRFEGREGLQEVAAELGGVHVLALFPHDGIVRGVEGG
jgi:hypothetical protein